jgi:hypothetical protein
MKRKAMRGGGTHDPEVVRRIRDGYEEATGAWQRCTAASSADRDAPRRSGCGRFLDPSGRCGHCMSAARADAGKERAETRRRGDYQPRPKGMRGLKRKRARVLSRARRGRKMNQKKSGRLRLPGAARVPMPKEP